ncbi:rod-binding protein [Taklimakanibacter albus]|uniref:Rod-binding protein n=1 Tax=Taklimakanibacter albus TaxID=2800327 RepID=A0ACC5RAC1_9HYPH|nr:rod-binding protein [Aestuariivirga sp. YIM B02566]MBK1869621.1 rod-binding protein [Aestuariivirga sp. YIM B02566]
MAIKPPSDIVLDVVRAADPVRRQAAADKLTGQPGTEATRHEFASFVGDVRPVPQSGACGPRQDAGDVPDAYRNFEAFFIQSFVENMLPKGSEANYGSGTAGDVWRSQLAEKIGTEIAESGGIGVADRLLANEARKAAGPEEGPEAGFSLSESISRAAPFGGWASYLPFLDGQLVKAETVWPGEPAETEKLRDEG